VKAALFGALIAFTPVSASALSCMPHSVEAAYLSADASDAHFVIVRGHLDFDARELPNPGHNTNKPPQEMTRINATLMGKSLSRSGFSTPFSKRVILAISCYGPWCATAQEGSEVLAFVELGEKDDVIATNPCGGYLFHTPTSTMINAVKNCFAGQACEPLR
jgi:hypothetical protein